MKNTYLHLTIIVLISAIAGMSCTAPNKSANNEQEGYLSMQVPSHFDFSSTAQKSLFLSGYDLKSNSAVAEIYNANPHTGKGKLIRRVNIRKGETLQTPVRLPSYLSEIWIVSRQNDGVVITHQVPLHRSVAQVNLADIGPTTSSVFNASMMTQAPDCNTGCDEYVDGSGLTINDGRTYCVKQGDTLTGTILFSGSGGTLNVCGTVQPDNVNVNGNPGTLEILIGESGVFQTSNLNLNSRDALLVNHGVLEVSGGLAFNYRFENYSEVSLHPFNVNSNDGQFLNLGTLNVSGNFNNNSWVHNKGTINVTGSFNNNGNSILINDCRIIANAGFHQNGDLEHYGYIQTNNTFYIQHGGNANSKMYSHSFVEANKAIINRQLTGPETGAYGRLNIESEIRINGGGSITGLLDLCVANGNIINNGSVANTTTYCEAYIPETECSPGAGTPPGNGPGDGNGTPPDDYPDDPDRSYDNPYPAEGVFGTLAYEDLWPSYGDFDMNDLVVGYHINEITNDDNKIVDIEFTCVIRALGAGYDSGFGVELSVNPSRVETVSGVRHSENIISTNPNGTEAGQNNAVIILWDNSAYHMGLFTNTQNPAAHVDKDTLRITVTFNPPVDRSELGNAPYKPFIFVDNNRGLEVHLPGNAPTALADVSFFGMHDDDTIPADNRYFVSRNNLNWAIDIPETIPYPLEKIEITEAYPLFRAWAESGGTVNTDWYLDLPGHRVNSLLYIRP